MNEDAAKSEIFRLLVPLDGSATAESVLPVIETLASQINSRVLLLHVIERKAPEHIHGERHLREVEEAESYLRSIRERLSSKGIDCSVHVHPNHVGDVARSILEHAGEGETGAIVLCTHGRGGLRDVIYGSIAQQVLANGFWPVLLIPAPMASREDGYKLRKILLPVDPSHSSDLALDRALFFSSLFSATLHLLCIVPEKEDLRGRDRLPGRYLFRSTSAVLNMAHENARSLLEDMRQKCAALGISTQAENLRGDAAAEIASYVHSHDIDLLIMASHGRAGFEAFLSRSTTPLLMARVACPMFTVRIEE